MLVLVLLLLWWWLGLDANCPHGVVVAANPGRTLTMRSGTVLNHSQPALPLLRAGNLPSTLVVPHHSLLLRRDLSDLQGAHRWAMPRASLEDASHPSHLVALHYH